MPTRQKSEPKAATVPPDPVLEREVEALAERLRAAGHPVSIANLVDEGAAAAVLGIERRTLREWRAVGAAPPWFDLRGAAKYDLRDLLLWLSVHRHPASFTPLAESGGMRRIAAESTLPVATLAADDRCIAPTSTEEPTT